MTIIQNCENCNEIFELPQSLSCGDVLCLKCVNGEIKKQGKEQFECPLCKEMVNMYFLNKKLNNAVGEFKKKQCKVHKKQQINAICQDCVMLVCTDCTTSVNHRGHIFNTITEFQFNEIYKQFGKEQYQQLLDYKKDILSRKQKVELNFNHCQKENESHKVLVDSTFNELINVIKTTQNEFHSTIDKTMELNQLSFTKLTNLVEDVEKFLNDIINRNDRYFNIFSNNPDQGINQDELNKEIQKLFINESYISIIDDFTETNNLLKYQSNINPDDFIKSNLLVNIEQIKQLKELIKTVCYFKKQLPPPPPSPVRHTTIAIGSSSRDINNTGAGALSPRGLNQQTFNRNCGSQIIKSLSIQNINKISNNDENIQDLQPLLKSNSSNNLISKQQPLSSLSSSNINNNNVLQKSNSNNSINSNSSNEDLINTIQSLPTIVNPPMQQQKISTSTTIDTKASLEIINKINQNKDISQDLNNIFKWNVVDEIPKDTQSICVISTQKVIPIGAIPTTVTSLMFSGYNQPIIEGSLPSSITSLHFGHDFNQDLKENMIPSSVVSLHLGNKFNKPLMPNALPSSIIELNLGESFNQTLNVGSIPTSVITLNLGGQFNQKITQPNVIPFNCVNLKFSHEFNQPLSPGIVPPCVKILEFGYNFNQLLLPGVLPKSITTLSFGYLFNQTLTAGTIPSSVVTLSFGYFFNQPIKNSGIIPPSVQSVSFGCGFKQSINKHMFPKQIKSILLPDHYIGKSELSTIPSTAVVSYKPKDF